MTSVLEEVLLYSKVRKLHDLFLWLIAMLSTHVRVVDPDDGVQCAHVLWNEAA